MSYRIQDWSPWHIEKGKFDLSHTNVYENLSQAQVEVFRRKIARYENKLQQTQKKNKKALRKKISKYKKSIAAYYKNVPEDFV